MENSTKCQRCGKLYGLPGLDVLRKCGICDQLVCRDCFRVIHRRSRTDDYVTPTDEYKFVCVNCGEIEKFACELCGEITLNLFNCEVCNSLFCKNCKKIYYSDRNNYTYNVCKKCNCEHSNCWSRTKNDTTDDWDRIGLSKCNLCDRKICNICKNKAHKCMEVTEQKIKNLKSENQKLKEYIRIHEVYMPDGQGAIEAKKDFEEQLSKQN